MLSNSDSLRRYLLHLPSNSQFKFTNDLKRDIRKVLFLALSGQGQYLDWVFPTTFQQAAQNGHHEFVQLKDIGNNGSSETVPTHNAYGDATGTPVGTSATDIYREAIQKIEDFDWLFSEYCKSISSKQIHNNHAYHLNLPCARIFRKGEPIYRCLTCGFDDTCALCSYCYHPEFHQGHKVHITICQRENGGVCDCGDPEAWVKDFTCPYTSPFSYPHDGQEEERVTPEPFKRSILETLEILLDYVIDVMSQCDLHFEDNNMLENSNKIEMATQKSFLNPLKYGYSEPLTQVEAELLDRNSDKYYLMVYNDQIRHYRDAVHSIYLALKKVPQFAVMITEKVQNYGKAKVISSTDINLLLERQRILGSTGLATCIRLHRDIFREDMCDEILQWIYDLTESEMFKSNNDFKNLFCSAFCRRWNNGLLNTSNSEFYTYKVGTLDPALRIPKIPLAATETKRMSSPAPPSHWSFEPSIWDLPEAMCQECQYNLSEDDYQPETNHFGSRFQYFIYLDVRFWKSIRTLLHDMYLTTLITNLQYKYILSCQYVDIYPTVADMFLTMDREPEINVMCTLSTQLFTCPTNSTSIVQHDDLSRIFALIYGFLTTDEIRSPDNIDLTHEISMKALKNRRWGQIFFDIGYILSRSKDNKSILTGNIIPMACDILALFQGRPVMKRESKNHIEYENPDYSAFFHAILVIYQFADYIAGCLSCLKEKLPNEEMKLISTGVIEYVIQFLLKLENNDYPGLIDEFVDINLSSSDERGKFMATVTEPIEGHVIQRYNIDKEKVSFLHPIHSFLSWLIELSDFDCADEIVDIFNRAQLSQQAQSSFTGALSASLPVFEYPIRTTVLMSQIKSGFWVRNGFSVRSQLQLYKNTGLRENGYMRDIFLIQVFINTSSPNLVCFLLFNRWLLMDGWINKTDEGPAYDVNTLPYIIEECLSFFIHILSEDLYLRNLNNEKISEIRVRNEIIHSLCFGPMNYTKLCAQIPDHVTSEKKFDIILEELTSFISPTGSKDIGVYKLKEENFELLNPYYFNYTTNTKDEAIKFVKERIHKKTGKPKSEIVIMPQTKDAEDLGIYKYIGNFAVSVHFQNFLITTLKYILQEGVQISDILLETVLHLIHICAYEKAIDVEKYGTFYKVFVDKVNGSSIANSLYDILSNEAFKQHHSKIRSIYKVFGKHEKYPIYKTLAEEITDFNIWKLEENDTSTSDENEYDRKKRLAKERQKKLLNKFKKQQTLFLENNSQGSTDGSLTVMGDGVMDLGTDEDEDDLIGWKFPEPHCLLCQNAAEDAGPFGIITNISKSSEFRTVPFGDDYWFLKAFSGDSNLDVEENDNLEGEQYTAAWKDFMNQVKENNVVGPGFSLHENVESKLVSSSCGHGMHFQCYLNYLNSSKSKLNQITRNTPENIDHKEFLCPLCKSINNMFVPVMWSSNKKSLSEFLAVSDTSSFDELNIEKIKDEKWFQSFVEKTKLDISDSTNLTPNAMEMIELHSNTDVNNIPITNNNENTSSHQYFRLLLSNMFQTLSLLTFPQIFKADSVSIYVNTIKSTEIGLRGVPSNGSLVINQLSNNSLINLRTLNEFRDTSLFLKSKLKMELDAKLELFLKQIANLLLLTNNSFNVSVLERDFFDLLVTVFPLPRLGFNFNTILKVCFLGTILQNFYIISTQIIRNGLFHKDGKYTILDVPQVEGVSDEVARVSASIFRKFDELYRRETEDLITENDECYLNQEVAFGKVIYSMVMKATVPFLRRAAIYSFVSCADVENVNILNYAEESEHASEADKLCTFLNISNIHNTVTNFSESGTKENLRFNLFLNYMNETITEPKSSAPMDSVNLRKNLEYPGIVKLIDLPDRLDFFFTKYYYLDIYDNPHRCIENPAICLFCGKVVDVQKSAIGCKEGQCTTHFLKECSNSVGIFLLLKERSLLLLHKNGGSFMSAPYLDLHGELASEAKRGKTLYLMKPRYNEFIKNVWLLHDIPNYIARKLDSVMDAGGWDTL